MATTIETLLDELQTYRAALEEPLEGSTDYERVNLQPDGHTLAIQGRDAFIDERTLVLAAIAALEALAGSSFPELPSFEADDAVMKDLDAQLATMTAFRARVRKKAPPAIAAAVTFTISDQT